MQIICINSPRRWEPILPDYAGCPRLLPGRSSLHDFIVSRQIIEMRFLEGMIEIVANFFSMVAMPRVGIKVTPLSGRHRHQSVTGFGLDSSNVLVTREQNDRGRRINPSRPAPATER